MDKWFLNHDILNKTEEFKLFPIVAKNVINKPGCVSIFKHLPLYSNFIATLSLFCRD